MDLTKEKQEEEVMVSSEGKSTGTKRARPAGTRPAKRAKEEALEERENMTAKEENAEEKEPRGR